MNQASREFSDALVSMQARHAQPGTALALPNGVPQPEGTTLVIPKYVDWFEGERTIKDLRSPPVRKTVPERELAAKTLGILRDAGVQMHDKIARVLPRGHRMEHAVLAELLKNIPYLGTCRIGRVPLGRTGPDNRFFSVAEFYVTNFDANITTQGKHFYNYASTEAALEAGPKFFGIGIIADQYGRRLNFDKRFGESGVYYQTKDEALAHYAIAAISTGRSFSELLSMDKKNQGKSVNSLSGLKSVPFGTGKIRLSVDINSDD
jgi:hypothetical protein